MTKYIVLVHLKRNLDTNQGINYIIRACALINYVIRACALEEERGY